MRFFLSLVLCLAPAFAADASRPAFDKVKLEAYIRHLLPFAPQVQVQIGDPTPSPVPGLKEVKVKFTYGEYSQDSTLLIAADGKHIVRGDVFDMNASPFQAQIDKLKTDGAPSFGTPGAPVTLVVFSDFECPLCREEAKSMRANLLKTYPTQVRVFFKDFPLAQIHPWAMAAAIAGRCIYHQEPKTFWDYYDWIYENQAAINADNLKAKVIEFAAAHNLDSLQLGHCLDTKATEKEVDASIAQGKSIPGLLIEGQRMDGVDSTPTLYMNGMPVVGNIPWDNLKSLIDKELNYQQTAREASEKCCEIKLPSVIK